MSKHRPHPWSFRLGRWKTLRASPAPRRSWSGNPPVRPRDHTRGSWSKGTQAWAGAAPAARLLHGRGWPCWAWSLAVGAAMVVGALLSILRNKLGHIFTHDE